MDAIPKDPLLEFLPDTLEAIRKIYNLENGRMKQSVHILEDWVKKQEHFLNKNFGRDYLEKTIVACKGSVEKAKKQIDKLCTLKTLLPKFFVCSDIKSRSENINNITSVVALPKMTQDYQRIFMIKIGNSKNLTSSLFVDYYRIIIIVAEYLKAHDYTNGFLIIEDFREANLSEILTTINIVEFQQFMTILTEGFGAKMKGIHILSESKVIDVFIKTVKTILSPKLAQRVHHNRNVEELHKLLNKELLPSDFGGKQKSIKELQADWMEVLGSKENEDYLAIMNASRTDESLRNTMKFNEECMGLPGSFRTLTVD